jgi:CubicO group peptidase (beta-lactamase class C family)
MRDGALVLNEAIGMARGFRRGEDIAPMPVEPQTPFPVLSTGKPLAAIAIALLEERGILDVQAPIAELFPEFARNGKGEITTLDVLTHRSGILMPEFVGKRHLWGDRSAIQEALIETVPTFPRGTLAYHPYEFGWILDEIVRRLDGKSLPDLFEKEIAFPLDLHDLRFGLAGRRVDSLAYSYWLGKEKVIVAGVNVAADFEWQNSEQFLDCGNPAVTTVSNAASLAAFYDFLLSGGSTEAGEQLIAEATIQTYTTREVAGWDRTLGTFIALGRGFMLGALFPSNYGWWNTVGCFGHAGGYSCLAFGDRSTGISAAILTNGNRSALDLVRRFIPLAHGLRRACRR